MTAFRTVQSPKTPKAALAFFLVGQDDDQRLREALPGFALIATVEAPKGIAPAEVLGALRKLQSVDADTPVGLVGFSAGCSSVRQLCISSHEWKYVACFDGTHAQFPEPLPWQISTWKDVAERARAGEIKAIFTCTSMTYTEKIGAREGGPFMSTQNVLARVLGAPLAIGRPVIEGGLYAERFPSESIDKQAHINQQNIAMPALLSALWGKPAVRPGTVEAMFRAPSLIAQAFQAAAEKLSDTLQAPNDPGAAYRATMVTVCVEEISAGVKEEPPGSNDGPRIREYDAIGFTRNGKPITAPKSAWCAKAASWTRKQAGDPGPYRLSVSELESDAKQAGLFRPKGAFTVKDIRLGDLLTFDRPGAAWKGHVARVIEIKDSDVYTAGGNEGDRWQKTKRTLHDPDLVGLILEEPRS